MIPDTTSIQLVLLKLLEDEKSYKIRNVVEEIAKNFHITEADREQLTPIGKRRTFDTRVLWAVSQLRNAGLLQNVDRGIFKITQRGLVLLKEKPKKIDNKLLMQFQEFREFVGLDKQKISKDFISRISEKISPIEILEQNYKELKQNSLREILLQVQSISPFTFEKLVVKLLITMGYGGKLESGQVTKKTRDGGIDGIINEDELGLGKIYIQAKQWKNDKHVTEPELHKFIGALHGKNAKKGIFLTTSDFTFDAIKYSETVGIDLALINGTKLADLLFKYNLGVFSAHVYEIKKLDSEFFDEL